MKSYRAETIYIALRGSFAAKLFRCRIRRGADADGVGRALFLRELFRDTEIEQLYRYLVAWNEKNVSGTDVAMYHTRCVSVRESFCSGRKHGDGEW